MAFQYNIIRAFEDEREEGREEGKVEAIIELLEEHGDISDALKERLFQEKNPDVLKRWLKLAAHSQTVEMFEEAISKEIYNVYR